MSEVAKAKEEVWLFSAVVRYSAEGRGRMGDNIMEITFTANYPQYPMSIFDAVIKKMAERTVDFKIPTQ